MHECPLLCVLLLSAMLCPYRGTCGIHGSDTWLLLIGSCPARLPPPPCRTLHQGYFNTRPPVAAPSLSHTQCHNGRVLWHSLSPPISLIPPVCDGTPTILRGKQLYKFALSLAMPSVLAERIRLLRAGTGSVLVSRPSLAPHLFGVHFFSRDIFLTRNIRF